MKKIVLINATAAKYGGALSIIESYIAWIEKNDMYNKYIVLNGKCISSAKNITILNISTSSFYTFIFSYIILIFYKIKYNVDIVVSLNNIPPLFSCKDRSIIYFHNLKILKENSWRSIVVRFTLRLTKCKIIVQTDFVKSEFVKKIRKKDIFVKWPGLNIFEGVILKSDIFFDERKAKLFIFPVSNIESENKNLRFLLDFCDFFKTNRVTIRIPSLSRKDIEYSDVFEFVGEQSSSGMLDLYLKSDAMIFTSYIETIGLPIYEFLTLGKPVFILDSPYIRSNIGQFDIDSNLIIFNKENFIEKITSYDFLKKQKINLNYLESDWDFLKL